MGHPHTKEYYLADGIYPEWSVFVKTHRKPKEDKYKRFSQEQEACRKDVEQAFGVMQSHWAIVHHPARQWSVRQMWEVMTASVIMHNMIIEEQRDNSVYGQGWDFQGVNSSPQTQDRYRFKIFSIHITIFETWQLITPSMKIWLIMFGLEREITA
jgi:hypothetical protein